MKFLIAILLTVFSAQTQAAKVLVTGKLLPAAPLVKAAGTVAVVEEANGSHAVYFAEDYAMSSGVVLDLKLCGQAFAGSQVVCLSQGEVRKLKGIYRVNVRFPLWKYRELRVFDVDLATPHARARLD